MFSKPLISRVGACALTAVVAIAAAGVGNAIAATDSDTIYACKDRQGNLRAVAASSDCTKNETPLEWNVEGPAGPGGQQGPAGPTGRARRAWPARSAGAAGS